VKALDYLPYLVAAWLFVVGLYGIVTSRNLIHAVTCLAVVQSSTYVLLLAVGYRRGAAAPVFIDGQKAMTLRGDNIANEFHQIVENYIEKRFGHQHIAENA